MSRGGWNCAAGGEADGIERLVFASFCCILPQDRKWSRVPSDAGSAASFGQIQRIVFNGKYGPSAFNRECLAEYVKRSLDFPKCGAAPAPCRHPTLIVQRDLIPISSLVPPAVRAGPSLEGLATARPTAPVKMPCLTLSVKTL